MPHNPALPFMGAASPSLPAPVVSLLPSRRLLLLFFSFLFSLKALAPQGWILDGLFA